MAFLWDISFKINHHSLIILLKGLCLSHTSSCLIFHVKNHLFFDSRRGNVTLKNARNELNSGSLLRNVAMEYTGY